MDEVKKHLKNRGFIQGKINGNEIMPFTRQELIYHTAMTHQTAPFVLRTENRSCPYVIVDINFDIFRGESDKHIMTASFLNNLDTMTVENIPFKKLSPINEFIALCLHHYKDLNSIYLIYNGSIKLALFLDIYLCLIKNAHMIKPCDLKKACEEKGVMDYIYYCIYFTNEIFNDNKLFEYIEVLETKEGIRLCMSL